MTLTRRIALLLTLSLSLLFSIRLVAQDDSGIVITPGNVDQIEQLAMYGRGRINALVYSPDGNTVAVATTVGVWFYDAHDLTAPPSRMDNVTQSARNLLFTQDGATLIFIEADAVQFYDMQSASVRTVSIPPAYTVQLSSDDRLLAVYTADGLQIYDMETLRLVNEIETRRGVTRILFSHDNTQLFLGTDQGHVYQWDIASGTLLRDLELLGIRFGTTIMLKYAPNGRDIIAGGGDGWAVIWSVEDGNWLELISFNERVDAIDFRPGTSNELIYLTEYGTIESDTLTTLEVAPMTYYDRKGALMSSSQNGVQVVARGENGRLTRWNAMQDRIIDQSDPNVREFWYATFSLDQTSIYANDRPGYLYHIDVETGAITDIRLELPFDARSLSISADETKLVGYLRTDELFVYDIETESYYTLDVPFDSQSMIFTALLSDYQTMYINTLYSVLQVNLSQGEDSTTVLPLEPAYDSYNYGIYLTESEEYMALGGAVNGIHLFDLRTNREVAFLGADTDYLDMGFSPDSRELFASTYSGVRIWNVETLEMIELETEGRYVYNITYSPTMNLIVGRVDNSSTLIFWEYGNPIPIYQIDDAHNGTVYSITFNDAGTEFLTAGSDGTIRLWGIPNG